LSAGCLFSRGLKLFGYVVLENHVHWIASAPNLSHELTRFKSFTARRIIDLLETSGAATLLEQLRYFKLRHKSDQEFQLWQEGAKPKVIEHDDVMWQKLGYIHNNPVKRGYVDDPLHWRWSSARNYAKQVGVIEVCTDW
jgi:putative transposase